MEGLNQNFFNEDTTKLINVKSGLIGLNVKFHFLNRKLSSAYVSASVGVFNFEYQLKDSILNVGQLLGGGVYNSVFIGYNKYFGDFFGIFLQTGFLNQPMQMSSLTFNGNSYDSWNRLQIEDWNVVLRGMFVNAGITLKFRNKLNSPKEGAIN